MKASSNQKKNWYSRIALANVLPDPSDIDKQLETFAESSADQFNALVNDGLSSYDAALTLAVQFFNDVTQVVLQKYLSQYNPLAWVFISVSRLFVALSVLLSPLWCPLVIAALKRSEKKSAVRSSVTDSSYPLSPTTTTTTTTTTTPPTTTTTTTAPTTTTTTTAPISQLHRLSESLTITSSLSSAEFTDVSVQASLESFNQTADALRPEGRSLSEQQRCLRKVNQEDSSIGEFFYTRPNFLADDHPLSKVLQRFEKGHQPVYVDWWLLRHHLLAWVASNHPASLAVCTGVSDERIGGEEKTEWAYRGFHLIQRVLHTKNRKPLMCCPKIETAPLDAINDFFNASKTLNLVSMHSSKVTGINDWFCKCSDQINSLSKIAKQPMVSPRALFRFNSDVLKLTQALSHQIFGVSGLLNIPKEHVVQLNGMVHHPWFTGLSEGSHHSNVCSVVSMMDVETSDVVDRLKGSIKAFVDTVLHPQEDKDSCIQWLHIEWSVLANRILLQPKGEQDESLQLLRDYLSKEINEDKLRKLVLGDTVFLEGLINGLDAARVARNAEDLEKISEWGRRKFRAPMGLSGQP